MDDCNAVLAGPSKSTTDKLQRVLNAAARVVSDMQIAEVRPRTQPSAARQAALAGRSSAGAVQAVCNGPSMSAAQSTTVHDGLLHPHLRHCSSAASAGWQVTPHHST